MRTIGSRLDQLERRFGVVQEPGLRMLVCAGGLALSGDRCFEILEECGFITQKAPMLVINLVDIPRGLNAEETERYLREHGAEICGRQSKQGRQG